MSTSPASTDPRAIIRHEAAALSRLADALDSDAFDRAVALLADCAGNVATVGMGTSGIVARKVAATLTSTGTPAHFVHPSDALHGGLGLIGRQAVIVTVSNGGETEEVLDLLPYLESRDVPVISIVGRAESTLGRRATVTLAVPVEREAGPHAIVPTASVVAQLAMADALALTVMERKGVTPEGFAINHPSGSLGRRLTLRVADVMQPRDRVAQTAPDALLLDALPAMTGSGLGVLAVVDGGDLAGIVTDGDLRRAMQRAAPADLPAIRVGDAMTRDPVSVPPSAMAFDALRTMEDRPSQIHLLAVVDERGWQGMLRLHDLVKIGL